jgi:branched-chain amino acid transport system permease protein
MEMLGQTLITGLLVGAVIALLSSGLTLIFGVMRVVNFAQGEFVMLGMYLALFLTSIVGVGYLQLLSPLIFVAFSLVGLVVYLISMKHVTGVKFSGGRGHDAQLILTLGLSLVLQNLALMIFGSKPHLLSSSFSGAWEVGGMLLNKPRTLGFGVAAVAIATLLWFLTFTRYGRVMRATADDVEAAAYMGIDVSRVHALAFSIGVGLAGVGGAILASFYPMQPYVGEDFIVLMFVAVVLGGLGSVTGALAGGLVIGITQAVTPLLLPLDLQNSGVFIIFLTVLFLRPQGMFGRQVRV